MTQQVHYPLKAKIRLINNFQSHPHYPLGFYLLRSLLLHPIDLAKLRQQVGSPKPGVFNALFSTISDIGLHEGYKFMYKGLSMTLLMGINNLIIYLLGQDYLDRPERWAIFGAVTSIINTPFELIKNQLFMYRYKTPVQAFRTILQDHTITGLYRGFTTNLIHKTAFWYGLSLMAYPSVLTAPQDIYGGIIILYIYGIEHIRNHMQSQPLSNKTYRNSFHCVEQVYRLGVKFWKGCWSQSWIRLTWYYFLVLQYRFAKSKKSD